MGVASRLAHGTLSWDSEETQSRGCRMFVVPSTKPRPAWVLHTCQVEEPGALADPERG